MRRLFLAALLAFICCLTGCAVVEESRSAEELFSAASSGLAGVDRYGFRVQTGISSSNLADLRVVDAYTGEVVEHDKVYIREAGEMRLLNATAAERLLPMSKLVEWETATKSVSYDEPRALGGTIRLILKQDHLEAVEAEAEYYREQFNKAADAALTAASLRTGGANDARAKVEQEIALSRRQLEETLRTLTVDKSAALQVERTRMLSTRLEETTILSYEMNGAAQTETRVTSIALDVSGEPLSRATD